MRLLVLDDDEAIGEFMAALAGERGWLVDSATDEATFHALIKAQRPDAILLDLQLGPSDGIEQLHFLHGLGYDGAIVLMSGFDARVLTSAQRVGESLGLQIVSSMEKPARAAQVREVLAAIEQGRAVAAPSVSLTEPAVESLSVDDVVQAMDSGQLELHLQPIVTAAGLAVHRAEALVRWRDPILGIVAPDRFIPAAEQDAQVMDRLTMWVAGASVAQYRRLEDLGTRVQICINISGSNLRSLDFPDRMAEVLERGAAPQGAIGLEITESVAMHDLDTTAAILTRLRLKGFPVALDDFGTGHSSLTTLRQMPFSAIKIDKSFVREVETSSDSLTIVRSVIQLAHDMRLASVAEGVTTADAARLLTELGIDSLQGYYFSEPLPFDGFAVWLREWSRTHATAT